MKATHKYKKSISYRTGNMQELVNRSHSDADMITGIFFFYLNLLVNVKLGYTPNFAFLGLLEVP